MERVRPSAGKEKPLKAAVISEQGMRPYMEDAHFLDLDFGSRGWVYAGIYDGHGGSFAADYASRRLHKLFLDRLLAGASPQEEFIYSYEAVSEELKTQDSGTTAVDFFIRDNTIYTANAGDARAIVIGRERVYQLTVDHRLDNQAERERVEKAGGRVDYPYTYRGYEGLMPTRTIGDEYFKSVGIIATPSVNEYHVTPDDLLVLSACDGLFDLMSNEEVADFALKFPEPEMLLEELKREVLFSRTGTDNLTVVAVKLGDGG